jgi:hypothetical protein
MIDSLVNTIITPVTCWIDHPTNPCAGTNSLLSVTDVVLNRLAIQEWSRVIDTENLSDHAGDTIDIFSTIQTRNLAEKVRTSRDMSES